MGRPCESSFPSCRCTNPGNCLATVHNGVRVTQVQFETAHILAEGMQSLRTISTRFLLEDLCSHYQNTDTLAIRKCLQRRSTLFHRKQTSGRRHNGAGYNPQVSWPIATHLESANLSACGEVYVLTWISV